MTKFFDRATKTLFITQGQTPINNLSDNPLIRLNDPQELPDSQPLRRLNASKPKHYVSTTFCLEMQGTYDKNHPTNADLVEVENTIFCP
jgi:hypothetical protein